MSTAPPSRRTEAPFSATSYHDFRAANLFVLIEQSTGYVKAINGGRGQKTANRTLNRATDSAAAAIDLQGHFLLCPGIDACGATLSTVYYDGPYSSGRKKSSGNWWGSDYKGYPHDPRRHYLFHEHRRPALHGGHGNAAARCRICRTAGNHFLVAADQTLSTAPRRSDKGRQQPN
ncbi:MAG: hypothetical protein ACLR8P_12705 [Clostridium fessum]